MTATAWDLHVTGGKDNLEGIAELEVCPTLPLYNGWTPTDADLPALRWSHGIACRLVLMYASRVREDGGQVHGGYVSESAPEDDLRMLDGKYPWIEVPWALRKTWRSRLEAGLVALVRDALQAPPRRGARHHVAVPDAVPEQRAAALS